MPPTWRPRTQHQRARCYRWYCGPLVLRPSSKCDPGLGYISASSVASGIALAAFRVRSEDGSAAAAACKKNPAPGKVSLMQLPLQSSHLPSHRPGYAHPPRDLPDGEAPAPLSVTGRTPSMSPPEHTPHLEVICLCHPPLRLPSPATLV